MAMLLHVGAVFKPLLPVCIMGTELGFMCGKRHGYCRASIDENSSRAAEALGVVADVIAEMERLGKCPGPSIDPAAKIPDTPKWDAVVKVKKEPDFSATIPRMRPCSW